jgi:hypothetical protein
MKSIFDLKFVAILLLLLIGVAAIFAGWLLISDPSGKQLQIPLYLLDHSIFNNYLVPGIILSIFIGFFSVMVIVFTLIETRSYPYLILLEACFLIGWLNFELIINLDFFSPILHFPLYAIGIILIIIGYFESKIKTS